MFISLFLSAYIIGFSGAMMPGPLLTVTISEAYRLGFKAGPLIVLGHAILEMTLVLGLTMGLHFVLINPYFKAAVALFGGIVLLLMGAGMTREAWRKESALSLGLGNNKYRLPPVISGVVISLSNPYWLIWWATIGMTYITLALKGGPLGLGVFLTGHLLADLTWYSMISFTVANGKKMIKENLYRNILIACGVFMFALGLYFVFSSMKFLGS